MRKFSCDEARVHLSDALAGEIGRPEANVLEAHLIDCEPCQSLSELFLWQDRVLTELAGQARIEILMSKVREGLQNLDQVSVEEEGRSRWAWSFSPWSSLSRVCRSSKLRPRVLTSGSATPRPLREGSRRPPESCWSE